MVSFPWIFCKLTWIIYALTRLVSCMNTDSFWQQDLTHPPMVCPTDVIDNVHVSSVTKCGVMCSKVQECTTFTFTKTGVPNCYLKNGVTQSEACSLQTQTLSGDPLDTKHYTKVERVFVCPPDDRMYRTVLLNDGTTFTYRVVHTSTLTNADTARADCESTGGFLAKLSTVAKLHMIWELVQCENSSSKYWVDGSNANATDYVAPGAWTFYDGEQMNMNGTFWATNTPNNQLTDHCNVIGSFWSWKFNDGHCTTYKADYICEKL